MASRSSPDVRRASLLLSGLVLTADDSLEAFRDRRVGNKSLDTAHLKRARDVLDAVHEAITEGDDARWQRLEEAWKLLCDSDVAPPAEDPEPAPPAVSPEPPPSAPSPPPLAVASPPAPAPPAPASAVAPPAPAPAPKPVASPPAVGAPAPGPSPWARQGEGGVPVSAPEPSPAPPPSSRRVPPPVPPSVDAAAMSNVEVELSDSTLPENTRGSDRTVLPFAGTAEPPPSAVADVKAAIDSLGQTRMDDGPAPAVTLPFKMPSGGKPPPAEAPPLPSHLRGLNLEHYAALCAERDVYKGWESQVEARYGITSEDDKKAVDAHFRAQLEADPSQMASWRKQYARVEAWAREQRGN